MIRDPENPKGSGIVDVWQETFPVRFGAIDKSQTKIKKQKLVRVRAPRAR